MPVYEYRCDDPACKEQFDELRKVSEIEKPPPPCPKCGGKSKKLVSRSSFQLKGGGWYSDGYS